MIRHNDPAIAEWAEAITTAAEHRDQGRFVTRLAYRAYVDLLEVIDWFEATDQAAPDSTAPDLFEWWSANTGTAGLVDLFLSLQTRLRAVCGGDSADSALIDDQQVRTRSAVLTVGVDEAWYLDDVDPASIGEAVAALQAVVMGTTPPSVSEVTA